MVEFLETERSLSVDQINVVENKIGLSFPNEYKEHLLKFNGGRCIPNIFSFKENDNITSSQVDWFLALYDGEYDSLENYIETYKTKDKRLPTHILPIAHDPGGNLICISCGNEDKGKIYFWDHEKEVDYTIADDKDYSNLYLISNSINEFIDSLKE